ncbi:MAG TPA: translation initiation factor IF-2 [Candidatus Avimonoglobus intestinipullorum]|uniref:Translation initiation factor IF-2 n=1 Tax=Candidatus Avimonoglobus intestinipullorum TaxID=2840699 RepID=A0A9D1LUJ7_9FIRM|nr:translation initiation factor IF-2 [Candidatus Avimonoglobus intestinipullorum]
MAGLKVKVSEIAKDLKVTGKDVVERLAALGIEVKSTQVLEDEQLGIILDIYTQLHDVGDKPIEKPPLKQPEPQPEPEQEAPEKPQAAEPAPKKEKPALKPQKKQQASRPVKRQETRIELIPQDADGQEDSTPIVVQEDQAVRYVDTRTSTVELETIETRERLEDMVSDMKEVSGGRSKKKKKNRNKQQPEPAAKAEPPKKEEKKKAEPKTIEIPETITVGELAQKLGKSAAEVVKRLMMLGVMATITQSIDFDTAALIADDFGIEIKKEIILTKEDILFEEEEDQPEDLVPRPPVVVVMGHVDHGKTSLLDAIRHTSVTETEAGGITQHIGAYSVRLNDRDITFLDTPGHEAFTTMRARGAQVTDVAILVVAADDGIMPQTVEAINHAKAAGVTIVVAINKIDKENANVERVKQMLVEHELVPEEWGGDTVCVEISAKKRINIDGLLEMVLLIADMKELKANPNKPAKGTVIEAQIDKGRGPVATVLVQEGTLHVGDIVIAGTAVGHVRAMVNDKGRRVKTAGPSVPVEIIGLAETPSGGDIFHVVKDEKLAREVAEARKQEQKETRFNSAVKVSLDNLFSQIDEGNMKELNVIIKADVQGSVEAVRQSLEKLSNDEVRVRAIHGGVGAVNESDVMLANASNAIIVGFNVRPDAGALSAAQQQEVDIRLYRVIYQAIEEIEAAMKGMLDPEFKEVILGHAEVRQTFKVSGVGTIAGAYVTDGKITRNAQIRLVRDGIVVHEGVIDSLKRFKDDAKEVADGFECGIGIQNFNDVKEGDVIECFTMEEIER